VRRAASWSPWFCITCDAIIEIAMQISSGFEDEFVDLKKSSDIRAAISYGSFSFISLHKTFLLYAQIRASKMQQQDVSAQSSHPMNGSY